MGPASSRQHPRVAVTFPVTYVVVGDDSVVYHGRTRDISGGGLSVDTREAIPSHAMLIALSFELRGIRIKARARVVGSSHDAEQNLYAYRCVFADISFETQTLLAAYVLRNALQTILTKALRNVSAAR